MMRRDVISALFIFTFLINSPFLMIDGTSMEDENGGPETSSSSLTNFKETLISDTTTQYQYRGGPQRTGRYDVNTSDNPGTLRWVFETDGTWIETSPVVGPDGVIYFGSRNSYFYAVNPNGTLKWRYLTGDSIGTQGSSLGR